MTDSETLQYGTIKIPRDKYERHNERRKDFGVTWAEYVDGQAPTAPAVDYGEVESRCKAAVRSVLEDHA